MPAGGVCETDLFTIPAKIGTEFYAVLNASSAFLNLTASEALDVAARATSAGVHFLKNAQGR